MSKSGKKHMGAGAQGKGHGTGGLTDEAEVPDNMVLSNRDKKQHSDDRGQDSKRVQTEQLRDHEFNQNKR
jgi:hypothetical protein